MNKKIAFYAPPFPGMKSYYDVIDAAEKYGLSAVEGFTNFELQTPDVKEAEKIKKYADRKNIKTPCMSAFMDLAEEGSRRMIERAKGYAEVAAILGSPYLHHTIVGEFSNPNKVLPQKEELFKRGIEAVREIYDYAEKLGVKTVFEDQGYIFNGVEGFGRFLDEVDRDVRVVADFGNIYQSKDGIEDFIKAFSEKICHVHIKDVHITADNVKGTGLETISGEYMNEVEIGTGDIDFALAIDLLKKAGYDGYYSIEYTAPEDNSPIIEKTLKFLDSLI